MVVSPEEGPLSSVWLTVRPLHHVMVTSSPFSDIIQVQLPHRSSIGSGISAVTGYQADLAQWVGAVRSSVTRQINSYVPGPSRSLYLGWWISPL